MRPKRRHPAVGLKPTFAYLCLLAASLLAIAGAKSIAARPAIVIEMLDAPPSFQPVRTRIKAGDTVEWKNVGAQLHHVTNDPAAALKKGDVSNPPGPSHSTPVSSNRANPLARLFLSLESTGTHAQYMKRRA
jgi:plastocyanin